MLTQTHSFSTDAELLAFQKRVLIFLSNIDSADPAGNECLFLSNNKTVRRRLVTIQATSHLILEEFNAFLERTTVDTLDTHVGAI
ncbi:MAG: hypothetical protein GYB36_10130 [Alphaproteobacteria bacterium]|nr:hypothetical protein [Alphaproteobacteria bacterium]